MKKTALEFIRRGLVACGFGPLVLAVIYLMVRHRCGVQTLSVDQVCTGIFSLSALAFVAGGMNVIYQMERRALPVAILAHGSVLYVSYLVTYLLNGWLMWGWIPIVVFSVIFLLTYLLIWAGIYTATRKNTRKINAMLKKKQEKPEDTVSE